MKSMMTQNKRWLSQVHKAGIAALYSAQIWALSSVFSSALKEILTAFIDWAFNKVSSRPRGVE